MYLKFAIAVVSDASARCSFRSALAQALLDCTPSKVDTINPDERTNPSDFQTAMLRKTLQSFSFWIGNRLLHVSRDRQHWMPKCTTAIW